MYPFIIFPGGAGPGIRLEPDLLQFNAPGTEQKDAVARIIAVGIAISRFGKALLRGSLMDFRRGRLVLPSQALAGQRSIEGS
jgi:hypothetical protein